MNTIETIKDICKIDNCKNALHKFLDLAILIDKNYHHIQQLETLTDLFKSGLSDYHQEYYPEQHKLAKIMAVVCENTRVNHYNKDKTYPTIYDVQLEIFGVESNIPTYNKY